MVSWAAGPFLSGLTRSGGLSPKEGGSQELSTSKVQSQEEGEEEEEEEEEGLFKANAVNEEEEEVEEEGGGRFIQS